MLILKTKYVKEATKNNNPVITAVVDDYNNHVKSRNLKIKTPLCGLKLEDDNTLSNV